MTNKHIAFAVSADEHYRTPYLKTIKENWPSMAKDFRHYCHHYGPKPGEVWTWTSPEGQHFYHLIINDAPKNDHLKYLRSALKNLKKMMTSEAGTQVDIPKDNFHFKGDEFGEAESLLKEVFEETSIQAKFL